MRTTYIPSPLQQDTEFAGVPIDLLLCSLKQIQNAGRPYSFQLVGKDCSLLLAADSETEMLEWIGTGSHLGPDGKCVS